MIVQKDFGCGSGCCVFLSSFFCFLFEYAEPEEVGGGLLSPMINQK